MQLGYPVLNNAAGVVNGTPFVVGQGGNYLYLAQGTFGGATVKLQILGPDATNYIDVPNSAMTVAGALQVQLPAGSTVRGAIVGGAATGIFTSLGLVSR